MSCWKEGIGSCESEILGFCLLFKKILFLLWKPMLHLRSECWTSSICSKTWISLFPFPYWGELILDKSFLIGALELISRQSFTGDTGGSQPANQPRGGRMQLHTEAFISASFAHYQQPTLDRLCCFALSYMESLIYLFLGSTHCLFSNTFPQPDLDSYSLKRSCYGTVFHSFLELQMSPFTQCM